MEKKIILYGIGMMALLISQTVMADSKSFCNGTLQNPCIVQDTVNNTPTLKHWRDNFDLAKATMNMHGNAKGLKTLWMSGSAEASVAGFNTIINHINKAIDHRPVHIVDVDLRKESHGFLNNNAITLANKNDWINLNKTRDEALWAEKNWLDSLSEEKKVYVVQHIKFKMQAFDTGKWVVVNSVSNEEAVAKAHHMAYLRITVNDHMKPEDNEVDRFVDFVDHIKPNTWMYFHCRGGLGRTTMFMVMYDMLHNADKVSLQELVMREASYPPHYNILKVWHHNKTLIPDFQKRALFIRQFYSFAKAHLSNPALSWSVWVTQKKKGLN